jgi:hypothetical protein
VLHLQADAQVRRRVLDEARNAAALTDPAIVTIYSVLDETDPPAIVMERVEGFALDRFAAELNFEQKARCCGKSRAAFPWRMKHGLSIATSSRTTSSSGRTCARASSISAWPCRWRKPAGKAGGFEGTPLYASPEQVRGEPLTRRPRMFFRSAV